MSCHVGEVALAGLLIVGSVRTLDLDRPLADALAVWGSRILAVGDPAACREALQATARDEQPVAPACHGSSAASPVCEQQQPPEKALSWRSPSYSELHRLGTFREMTLGCHQVGELILHPSTVLMPSFHDSHCHPAAGGLQMIQCNLRSCANAEQALQAIGAFAAKLRAEQPAGEESWLCGGGWQPQWFENETPTAALLDSVCPDLPVYLRDINGHELWTNTLGMQRAGITTDTPDPPTGVIVRDPHTKAPVGHLLEEASKLVARVLPKIPQELKDAGLLYALNELARCGVTSVHDAAVGPSVFETYCRAASFAEPSLPVSVHMALQWGCISSDFEANLQWLRDRRRQLREESLKRRTATRLFAETVKIFVDGLPENCTAAMHQPYVRHQHTTCSPHGKLNYSADELRRIVVALSDEGFQIHMHVLGDAAVTCALDALSAIPLAQRQRLRHIVAHVQFLLPSDLLRFRDLHVVTNMSPFWFQLPICELAALNVGSPRGADQFPCRSILESGAHLCFGSDWPVSSLVPLEGVQVAVTRRPLVSLNCESSPAWNYEQAIRIDDAFRIYTTGSASANFREHEVGKLKKHMQADLIAISPDPYSILADQLHSCKVVATFLAGSPTFVFSSLAL